MHPFVFYTRKFHILFHAAVIASTLAALAGVANSDSNTAAAAPATEPNSGAVTIIRSNVPGPAMRTQRFFLTYDAVFDIKEIVRGEVVIWVPFPAEDDIQTVENYWMGGTLPPEKLLSYSVKRENENGNRYIEARIQDPEPGDKLSFQYSVVRREYSNPPVGTPRLNVIIMPPARRFLQTDGIVPLDGIIEKLASEALAGIDPKTSEGRDAAIKALYNKTLSTLTYESSGENVGHGDLRSVLKARRGDSVDFALLLIGMARASGIPAKLETGVSIPNDKAKGALGESHSWVYLYHPQRGWVPLDASEGWKNERQFAEYYQGRIGSDRVTFSTGRNLKLGQRGGPLHFFIYPYAEMAAQKTATAETTVGTAAVEVVPVKANLTFEKLAFP